MTIADEIQALSDDRTEIQNAILAKGGTVTSADGFDDFASAIATIPSGGGSVVAEQKDVNFIDYDGTILYSYTTAEFAELSAMPNNPSHSGLTAQGWNWTLADAKAYVADYGKLWIGQMYITNDGKTRIYIHLEEGRLSPMLGICISGTVDIDWGDNSAHSTLSGTSLFLAVWTENHNYSSAGDYVIKLTVTGNMSFMGTTGNGNGSCLLRYSSSSDNRNNGYITAIKKIEIGSNVTSIRTWAFYQCYSLSNITIPSSVTSIEENVFRNCYGLSSITIPNNVANIYSNIFYYCQSLSSVAIPKSVTTIYTNAFYYCYILSNITIPSSVTSISNYAFNNCYVLSSVILPSGVTSIGNNAFYQCYSLSNITIPSSVTSIGTSAFYNCYSLKFIKFESATPPTVSNSNAWANVPRDCIIYVPAGSLSAYTSAANYPNSSTYTYVEY